MTRFYDSLQSVTDMAKTLSLLFEAPPRDDSRVVEYRLSSSWTSLLKIKAYEEVRSRHLLGS